MARRSRINAGALDSVDSCSPGASFRSDDALGHTARRFSDCRLYGASERTRYRTAGFPAARRRTIVARPGCGIVPRIARRRAGDGARATEPRLHPYYAERGPALSLLVIILIVIVVLALLGFFGRGRF